MLLHRLSCLPRRYSLHCIVSSNCRRFVRMVSLSSITDSCRYLHSFSHQSPHYQASRTLHSSSSSSGTENPTRTIASNSRKERKEDCLENRIYNVTHGSMGSHFRMFIRSVIRELSESPDAIAQAKAKFIEEELWIKFCSTIRRKLSKSPESVFQSSGLLSFLDRVEKILSVQDSDSLAHHPEYAAARAQLLSVMLALAEVELREEIDSSLTLMSCSDLRLPQEWYSPARLMKRKIIFHGGPTNSGKTYHALQRLIAAEAKHGGGLYCGPLRLLALEVYEQLNKSGVYCNLITGQEQRKMPFSTHTSCTVEVVPVNTPFDVAIIDEIQMIGDVQRGFAWTRALLGLCAREIHVAGGIEAAPVVREIAERTGDSFELRTYERLSKLIIEDSSLKGDYSRVRPGDCVVAFSKFDIFSIKREIEKLTSYKCCVVYGKLPPETRSKQARLFNEPNNGYDILVASDAIGMGLNLNIRRIIFHTAVKPGYNGSKKSAQFIEAGHIKQIAGRAGRLSSEYDFGEVTTWQELDLAYVRAVMNYDVPPIKKAGLFPSVEQIDLFSRELLKRQHSNESDEEKPDVQVAQDGDDATAATALEHKPSNATARLSTLLKRFVDTSQTSGDFFLCEHSNLIRISNWLNTIPMSLTDRFVFGNAPVSTRDNLSLHMLYHYAAIYATNRPVPLKVRFPRRKPTNLEQFSELCDKHSIIDLYLWLANRFPKNFIEKENCLELKEYALKVIQSSLEKSMLNHQYSHSEVFRSQRKRLVEAGIEAKYLPHTLSAELRKDMMAHLQKFPENEWYMFPNESYSGEQSQDYKYGSLKDRKNFAKKKPLHRSRDRDKGSNSERISHMEKVFSSNVNSSNKQNSAFKPTDAPRSVKVSTKQRITKSADGRKVQKWNC